MDGETIIETQGLTKTYKGQVAVDDLSFRVAEGEIFRVSGPQRRRKDHDPADASLFEKVTEARATAIHATRPADKSKAENLFQESIRTLFAVAEAYPELKASENFRQLQMQLKELEDGIEHSRRYYNAVVRDFNILIESFPSSVVASQFKFAQEEFFELEAPEVERKPVKVSFS